MEKSKYIETASLVGASERYRIEVFACILKYANETLKVQNYPVIFDSLSYYVKHIEKKDEALETIMDLCMLFKFNIKQSFEIIRLYLDEFGQLE